MLLFILTTALILKVLAILAGIAVIAGGIYVIGNWDTVIGKEICVLGLPQTGKTLFYLGLQGKWDIDPDETNVDKINTIKLKDENGKTILKIRETKDIGGAKNYVRQYYEPLVKNSDVIVYFCNIHEYMDEKHPQNAKDVRARLQLIHKILKDNNKVNENAVRMILSYADLVDDRKEALTYFVTSIAKEDYSYFAKNVATVNMTNKDEVEKLIKLLFYGER